MNGFNDVAEIRRKTVVYIQDQGQAVYLDRIAVIYRNSGI